MSCCKQKKKMSLDLYCMLGSAPCQAVFITARVLNLKLNLKFINLLAGDHQTPEFTKLNPQQTVPLLVDDGFALSESRAIITYLVNKYGKSSGLYPEEPRARGLVDQRLYFEAGTLCPLFMDYFYPQLVEGAPDDQAKLEKLHGALKTFDTFLEGQKYAAGAELTVADLSFVANVSIFEAAGIDIKKFPNVIRWFETVKSTAPGYNEANDEGLEAFRTFINHFKQQ